MQGAHLGGQGGLITDGGRHPAQQSGDFRAGLGKPEDIVDEEKNILMLHVPEIFRHGKPGQAYPHSGSGRLIHLTINQSGLSQNAGLLHFIV